MNKILLIGAGGHARSCIDVIEQGRCFSIVGLVDNDKSAATTVLGYPVFPNESELSSLRERIDYALVCIGQIESPEPRIRNFELLKKFNFELPIVCSPLSYVSKHARLEEGVIVMHYAMINAGATVGKNCIINSGAIVEHDAIIGNYCHISTNSVVNGGATIGSRSFVGSGAVIREGVSVGKDCVIGGKCFVSLDTESGEILKDGR